VNGCPMARKGRWRIGSRPPHGKIETNYSVSSRTNKKERWAMTLLELPRDGTQTAAGNG